jgi:hypothetical protein
VSTGTADGDVWSTAVDEYLDARTTTAAQIWGNPDPQSRPCANLGM